MSCRSSAMSLCLLRVVITFLLGRLVPLGVAMRMPASDQLDSAMELESQTMPQERPVMAELDSEDEMFADLLANLSSLPEAKSDLHKMCQQAVYLDQGFPHAEYSSHAVRMPMGDANESIYVAVREFELASIDAMIKGSTGAHTMDATISGTSSCDSNGGFGRCAEVHIKLMDLEFWSPDETTRAEVAQFNLKGAAEVVVTLSASAAINVGDAGPQFEYKDFSANVVRFGCGYDQDMVMRSVLNSAVVPTLLKKIIETYLVVHILDSPLLTKTSQTSFNLRAVPYKGKCKAGSTCLMFEDIDLGLKLPLASLLRPGADLAPSANEELAGSFLEDCAVEEETEESSSDGSVQAPKNGIHTTKATKVLAALAECLGDLQVNFKSDLPKRSEKTLQANAWLTGGKASAKMSMQEVLLALRDYFDLEPASVPFQRERPISDGWITAGKYYRQTRKTYHWAVKDPSFAITGDFTMELAHDYVHGKPCTVVLGSLRRLDGEFSFNALQSHVLLPYLMAWAGGPTNWLGIDGFRLFGKGPITGRVHGDIQMTVGTDTGKVLLCLQEPCGGHYVLDRPQVTLELESQVMKRLKMLPNGDIDMRLDVAQFVENLCEEYKDWTRLESARGPIPHDPSFTSAVRKATEGAQCDSNWVTSWISSQVKSGISSMFVADGLEIGWTPSSAREATDERRIKELEQMYTGMRYLIGRVGPHEEEKAGEVSAVAWQDEAVGFDGSITILPATPAALYELGIEEGDFIIKVGGIKTSSATGHHTGDAELAVTLINPSSTDASYEKLFYWTSTENDVGQKVFSMKMKFSATMVLKDGKLIGCLGQCCSKSITYERPTFEGLSFWVDWAYGIIDWFVGGIISSIAGGLLPHLLEPLVESALGSVSLEGDSMEKLAVRIRIRSSLYSPYMDVQVVPTFQTKPNKHARAGRRAAQDASQTAGGTIATTLGMSYHEGVLSWRTRSLKVLAETLLSRIHLSHKAQNPGVHIPFSVSMDKAYQLTASMPQAAARIPWAGTLSAVKTAFSQPWLYWQHRALDAGFKLPVPYFAEKLPAECEFRQPLKSRPLQRDVSFEGQFYSAIEGGSTQATLEIQNVGEGSYSIAVKQKAFLQLPLSSILNAAVNDPGATNYYFNDWSAADMTVAGAKKSVSIKCGSLIIGDDVGPSFPAPFGYGKNFSDLSSTCVETAAGSICGSPEQHDELMAVLKDEVKRGFAEAKRFRSCAHYDNGPSSTTAFGAYDPHVVRSFTWQGDATFGLKGRFLADARKCLRACEEHPACSSLAVVPRPKAKKGAWSVTCSYSYQPLPNGIEKVWIVK
mmetsp:Transcript_75989/g.180783  ORF Transcript_75989/g.180783 Transcript_75989/m.180783 type:complete len:1313 (-) Transcript_75989:132-4070(-)